MTTFLQIFGLMVTTFGIGGFAYVLLTKGYCWITDLRKGRGTMTASDFGIVKRNERGELEMLVWRQADGKFVPAKLEELTT